MVHQVLANDRFWTCQPETLIQRYDQLVTEPQTGVEQLAAHLGIKLQAGEAARVAQEYSFEANRARTNKLGQTLKASGLDLNDPAVTLAHDHQTLLHWNHLREGRVGDWIDRATPAERLVLHQICGRWLDDHGYPADHPDEIAPHLEPEDRGLKASLARTRMVARGFLACWLRCQSLRYPRLARTVKPWLGIAPEMPLAPAAPEVARGSTSGHEKQGAVPAPHVDTQTKSSSETLAH